MSESKEPKGKATAPNEGDNNPRAKPANPAPTTEKPSKGKSKATDATTTTTAAAADAEPATEKKLPKMSTKEAKSLLEKNPALKNEMAGVENENAPEALQKMSIADLLTGLSVGGKNQKDMASYKFWQTQPVTRFEEQSKITEDGPIKVIDPAKVSKEPDALLDGFEWTTLDLKDEKELQELWDLLTYHYVEDDDAMFRFRYSQSFLQWCVLLLKCRFFDRITDPSLVDGCIGPSCLLDGKSNGTSVFAPASLANWSLPSAACPRRFACAVRSSKSSRSTSSASTRSYGPND